MPTPSTPSKGLYGPALTPSQISHWLTRLGRMSDDGMTVQHAIEVMEQSGITRMQAQMLIRTFMLARGD